MKLLIAFVLMSLMAHNKLPALYSPKEIATCVGAKPCAACKNCTACGHCGKGGGTCGICAVSSTPRPLKSSPAKSTTSGQCKAITKKGSQCSRNATVGAYCWQHGK